MRTFGWTTYSLDPIANRPLLVSAVDARTGRTRHCLVPFDWDIYLCWFADPDDTARATTHLHCYSQAVTAACAGATIPLRAATQLGARTRSYGGYYRINALLITRCRLHANGMRMIHPEPLPVLDFDAADRPTFGSAYSSVPRHTITGAPHAHHLPRTQL